MGEPGPFVRGDVEACALCGQGDAPYVYLQDQQHYCIRCARRMLVTEQMRPAGRRADDLTVEDVLFRELPDPRISGDGESDLGGAEG